jgi:acetamidase/formamidase
MRTIALSAIAATFFLMTGCNNAKSPDAVAKDVAAAEQKASTETANSENQVAKDLNKATDQVNDKLTDLNNVAAKDAYKLSSAKADGDLRVALANCNALNGDAQKTCKDQANADYKATIAVAMANSQAAKE